jgi:hypothetical protein
MTWKHHRWYFLQVLRTAVGHRLAKVQGYLFKAAFLRRVPTFTRLIVENLILCFLQSAVYQTSKYLTGSLNLRFKKILTDLVHADYFQVHQLINFNHVFAVYVSFYCTYFTLKLVPQNMLKYCFLGPCLSMDWYGLTQKKNWLIWFQLVCSGGSCHRL